MELFFFFLFLCSTLFPLFHMLHAFFIEKVYKNERKPPIRKIKKMTILIPCYNEQDILKTSIEGMIGLNYSSKEVIYINDGSSDQTMETLKSLLQLKSCSLEQENEGLLYEPIRGFYQSSKYPYIYVIDKENGGKADALNAGVQFASSELIVTLDADSILAENALGVVNHRFQDENVIAAGGMVHVLQGASTTNSAPDLTLNMKHILRFQLLEFIKGFYVFKTSLARLNALSVISGAFGIFKKDVLLKVNGFRKTIGEDIDITLKFQQYIMEHPHTKMISIPEALCYTECPETWRDLFKQRVRWQKAYVDCLLQYGKFFFTTFYHKPVSFFFVIEAFLVNTLIPYAVIFSFLVGIAENEHNIDTLHSILIYMAGGIIGNVLYSLEAIHIAKKYNVSLGEKRRLMTTIFLELLFYRFILIGILMYGTIAYFFNKHSWNKVSRTGRNYELANNTQKMAN